MPQQPLDAVPLWVLVAATLLLVRLAAELGYLIGRQRSHKEKDAPVAGMVGATLGLLALLLAFTFGMASTRFDARRMVLLEEATAIERSYLRAGLLPEPHRTRARDLLRQYVEARLEGAQSADPTAAVRRSEELQRLLWGEVVALTADGPPALLGLFATSVNDVIDIHAKRVMLALRNRIPMTIWVVLYVVAILGVGSMGYHAGLSGTKPSIAFLALSAAITAVLWLSLDLDRPREGLFRVSQQAMIDLKEMMSGPVP